MFGNDNQDQNSQNGGSAAGMPAAAGIPSFTMDPARKDNSSTVPATPTEPAPIARSEPPEGVTSTELAPLSAPVIEKAKLFDNPTPPAFPGSKPSNDATDNAVPSSDKPVDNSGSNGSDEQSLLSIKQQALAQLTPLVNHLDQTPEDKFKTLMMMIQASDDQSLISKAYATAQQITDEKSKAQALLDIVNEINYFTHQNDDEEN